MHSAEVPDLISGGVDDANDEDDDAAEAIRVLQRQSTQIWCELGRCEGTHERNDHVRKSGERESLSRRRAVS